MIARFCARPTTACAVAWARRARSQRLAFQAMFRTAPRWMRRAATGARSMAAGFCIAMRLTAKLLASLHLPVSQPTMCAFVGPALDEMVVTSAREKLTPSSSRESHMPAACFGFVRALGASPGRASRGESPSRREPLASVSFTFHVSPSRVRNVGCREDLRP